jgi:hypothetical protein
VSSSTQAEALKDTLFTLNQWQLVPSDFGAAYQRKALIVVEFFKKGEDPFYFQELKVDDAVHNDLNDLRSDYPEVELLPMTSTNRATPRPVRIAAGANTERSPPI